MDSSRLTETLDLADQARSGDHDALKSLCKHLAVPWQDHLPQARLPEGLAERLDVGWARKNRLVPFAGSEESVTVATSNPLAVEAIDELAFLFQRRIELVGAPEEEVLAALNMLFAEGMGEADDLLKEMDESEGHIFSADDETTDLIDSSDAAPVIRLVNRILFQAVSERCSDVHIEPGPLSVNVRLRIDGVLYDRLSPPKHWLPFLISRIKVMAGLDIAEKRLPQDGRFQFSVAERSIDVRVSVIPTAGGERVVLRLLDKSTALLGLEDLGMEGEILNRFVKLVTRPNGIILATGPTGSGKTTSLYAALSRLNTRDVNIITIEDPVEYHLAGVGQIHVNNKVGLTFARGLRSVLRHDPDVIMIGEIRDLETAEIAIQSSLTGHLVFSTLHTNDAPSAVTRLVDMGIEAYLVSSAVIGVVAQRLVRRLCPHCRVPDETAADRLAGYERYAHMLENAVPYRPEGCDMCSHTGYRGRAGLYELLLLDDAVQATLSRTSESNEIRRAAIQSGMIPLVEVGIDKVRKGVTSLEEVFRVTMT